METSSWHAVRPGEALVSRLLPCPILQGEFHRAPHIAAEIDLVAKGRTYSHTEKAVAPHSSTLAWKSRGRRSLAGCSPWGRRVGHDWATSLSLSLSCIGEGNGSPLQCSCLENPRDGGAWWAAVCGVAQNQTRLKRLSSRSTVTRAGGMWDPDLPRPPWCAVGHSCVPDAKCSSLVCFLFRGTMMSRLLSGGSSLKPSTRQTWLGARSCSEWFGSQLPNAWKP